MLKMSKNKYPVKAKKNAVHSKVNGISLRRLSYFYDLMLQVIALRLLMSMIHIDIIIIWLNRRHLKLGTLDI